MDTLLYGRDLDGSGESPHRGFMQTMHAAGYAGEPSGHKDAKQENAKRESKKREKHDICFIVFLYFLLVAHVPGEVCLVS